MIRFGGIQLRDTGGERRPLDPDRRHPYPALNTHIIGIKAGR